MRQSMRLTLAFLVAPGTARLVFAVLSGPAGQAGPAAA
jgi:hypothetical protein